MAEKVKEDSKESLSPSNDELKMISKIKEILIKNGIVDEVKSVAVKDSGLKGENLASITNYITVQFESGKPPLNLFSKKGIAVEGYGGAYDDTKMFEKEATFFMEYLPIAKDLCKSKGLENLMEIYPKCYYADGELLVFENLVVDRGFVLLDKLQKQGMEAATFSLRNLAKHHAISHAVFQDKFGGCSKALYERFPYIKVIPILQPSSAAWFVPGVESSITTNSQILQESNLEGSLETIEKLEEFRGKPYERLKELIEEADENKLRVLNHGDYWNNNMLFQKEEGKIVSQVSVDFQLVALHSPAMDIGYYFFTSLDGEFRRENGEELLKIYLEALKETAEQLGYPIALTLEELKKDYCKYFEFGFYFGKFMGSDVMMQVMKEVDVSEMTNVGEWSQKMDVLMKKWLKDHPEERKEIAQALIDEVKEYEQLKSGIFP